MIYQQTITLSKEEAEKINTLLSITGEEAYSKYGLKYGETIVHTALFPNNYFIDVKLCISEPDDTAWTEAVLFDENGKEVCCTDCYDEYVDDWEIECEGVVYKVEVKVA